MGINTILDLKLKFAMEWSSKNEKKIETYFAQSSNTVIWKCTICTGEYLAPIVAR
ncbi:hypothetical protein EFP00_09975 [Lactiplantibacillus paraplantarum]|nr:hypothetical protein [Lactiplantibacillus paraplantarum]